MKRPWKLACQEMNSELELTIAFMGRQFGKISDGCDKMPSTT